MHHGLKKYLLDDTKLFTYLYDGFQKNIFQK
jgi:hypothetical protein